LANLSVSFLGAARNVTGSRHLFETPGARVLVDAGLYQERQNAQHNWEEFPVPPREIDAIALTHAHIDHAGILPRLVRQGYRGLVHCSKATAEVAPLVLFDAVRLQLEDLEWKRKRHAAEGRTSMYPIEPLYEEEDVEATTHSLRGYDYGKTVEVAPGVTATFYPSGHILGASMVLVEHLESKCRVLFSGDLGRAGRPLMPNPWDPPEADLVVVESTYGDRVHDDTEDVTTQLENVIRRTQKRGGTLLIPCFAVERAQELLFHLQKLRRGGRMKSVPIFLDSPMAVRLLNVFRHHPEALDELSRERLAKGDSPFSLPELKLCTSRDESKKINEVEGPAIIIAGSGMCNGGRIKHHLARHLENENSTLLFVGYQASGTLGRQLLDGNQEVRLFGKPWPVALEIEQIHGFSGHADRNELLDWLGKMPNGPKRVAVVHGGSNVTQSFAEDVRKRFGCPVDVPEFRQRIEL
jgi:metallo-beta-lactamase family protein